MHNNTFTFPRYVEPGDIRSAAELLRGSDLLQRGYIDVRVRRVDIYHESEAGLETASDFFSESLRAVSEGTLNDPVVVPEEEEQEDSPVLILICEDEETEEEEDEPQEEEPDEEEEEL